MAHTQALPPTDEGDALIGERVHSAMWRARVTQTQLAAALGLDQAAVSRRLRGRTAWKVTEVMLAARVLRVPLADLLPTDLADLVGPDEAARLEGSDTRQAA